jgi:hypothetical protein
LHYDTMMLPLVMESQSNANSTQLRDAQLAFYVTKQDAQAIKDFARKAGFRSTSQLMTAIMERLVIGGFSPMVFVKTGFQIQKFAEKNGAKSSGNYWGIRPLPALDDEEPTPEQMQSLMQGRHDALPGGEGAPLPAL